MDANFCWMRSSSLILVDVTEFQISEAYSNLDLAKIKYKKVKLSLCLTNKALRHEGAWGSGCIDPHFLDFDSSWR
jgi:hypothetical protein